MRARGAEGREGEWKKKIRTKVCHMQVQLPMKNVIIMPT